MRTLNDLQTNCFSPDYVSFTIEVMFSSNSHSAHDKGCVSEPGGRPENCLKAIATSNLANHMAQIDPTNLMRSFTERRREADQPAREVLDEFIRVGRALAMDSVMWHEVAGLDQSWRDTLSDSQVIKYLRALHSDGAPRKRNRRNSDH